VFSGSKQENQQTNSGKDPARRIQAHHIDSTFIQTGKNIPVTLEMEMQKSWQI
jgi:hypothetical protein